MARRSKRGPRGPRGPRSPRGSTKKKRKRNWPGDNPKRKRPIPNPELYTVGDRSKWTPPIPGAKYKQTNLSPRERWLRRQWWLVCPKCGAREDTIWGCPEECKTEVPHRHQYCPTCEVHRIYIRKKPRKNPDKFDRFYLRALLDGPKTGQEVARHIRLQTAYRWDWIKITRRLCVLKKMGHVDFEYRFIPRKMLWRMVYDYKRVYHLTEKGREYIVEWVEKIGK